MLTEKRFDAGAVELNYVEGPNAGPPLVFLHGITSAWQRFMPAMPTFMLQWRVVAVDLRGHGASGRVPNGYGLMPYAHDIIRLLRHLGDEPAVVAGHSLGAMIAIGLASEAPSLVSGVVLEDPPLGAFNGQPFANRPENTHFRDLRALLRTNPSVEQIATSLSTVARDGEGLLLRRQRATRNQRIDPEVLTPVIEDGAIDDYDLADRLARVSCPTLLLQGDTAKGGALSDELAAWAASLIPDCVHVANPDAGHDILFSYGPQGGRYVDLVNRFLEPIRLGAG